MRSFLDCIPTTDLDLLSMYEHLKIICIFIIIYFQNVASYRLYQLDSAEGRQLLPRIKQLLLKQGNDVLEYQNANVRHEKREQPRFKPMGRAVFVKRKIPHGYTTGEYEYDSKLNTVFRPLARYHVKKPIENHEISILKDMKFEQQQNDKFGKDLIVLVQKDESQSQLDLLNQIQKYINEYARQQKRKKKGRFQGMYNKYYDKGSLMLLRDKSGEEHDPFAPGKLPPELQPVMSSAEVIKTQSYASYPFHNYWTYSKNILQDNCPGNLVKVGNMCMSTIGHRKSARPYNGRRSSHHEKRHSMKRARKRHLYGRKK